MTQPVYELLPRGGKYKYRLTEQYTHRLGIAAGRSAPTRFVQLRAAGSSGSVLQVEVGYAWDGPSGPTIDTVTGIRASLVHDALYQLIRLGLIGRHYRRAADREFHRILLEDGMTPWRALLWYWGVRIGGWRHC